MSTISNFFGQRNSSKFTQSSVLKVEPSESLNWAFAKSWPDKLQKETTLNHCESLKSLSVNFLCSRVSCARLTRSIQTGRSNSEQAGRTNTNPQEAKNFEQVVSLLRPAVLASQSRWVGLGGAYSHSAPTDHRSQNGSTALWGNLRREFPFFAVCYQICQGASWHQWCAQVSSQADCVSAGVYSPRTSPPPPPPPVRQCLASPRQWMSASGRQLWPLLCSHSYWHQTDAKQQRSWISLKFSVQRLLLILCSNANWHQFSARVVALVYYFATHWVCAQDFKILKFINLPEILFPKKIFLKSSFPHIDAFCSVLLFSLMSLKSHFVCHKEKSW